MTNSSLDSQTSFPPTSIEAILHISSSAATDDLAADPRLASAPNWTRVTTDTHFLANLLSSWTEREHVFYHYLDRDAFLDDMANGRTDYCSELLVNALLASACVSQQSCYTASGSPELTSTDTVAVPFSASQR